MGWTVRLHLARGVEANVPQGPATFKANWS
jgi:hypothetical protein